MSRFTALPVSEKLSRAVNAAPDDIIMQVKPPKDSDGIEESIELFKSFYTRDIRSRFLRSDVNNSPVCGFELWYDDEALKFMFAVPDEEQEQHYRRQISGHFPGVDVERVWKDREKFVNMNEGDWVSSFRMDLKHHYFEPIRSPASLTDDFDNDPYQTLLSELDTKDPNTKTIVQVLYKPAEDNWTDLHTQNVETYAQKLQNSGGVKTRWFGLVIDEVETPKEKDQAVKQIRKQVNKPAYYVNLRVCVVADEQEKAESHANNIASTYENQYREATKQTFTPKFWNWGHERKTKDLLLKMVRREPEFMSQPASPVKFIRHQLWECETKIMTIPELTGLAHIPSGEEINVDSVAWTDAPVSGVLPPEAEKFSPVSNKEERRDAIKTEEPREEAPGESVDSEPDDEDDEWDEPVPYDPTKPADE